MYVRGTYNDIEGTSSKGRIKASYKKLVRLFGAPYSGDGYRTSTEWILKDSQTGDVFTIYDYKDTSLYSDDLPSPEVFRRKPSVTWNIGGTKSAATLKAYIKTGKKGAARVKAHNTKHPLLSADQKRRIAAQKKTLGYRAGKAARSVYARIRCLGEKVALEECLAKYKGKKRR